MLSFLFLSRVSPQISVCLADRSSSWKLIAENCRSSQEIHPHIRVLWSPWTTLRSHHLSLRATFGNQKTINCHFPHVLINWCQFPPTWERFVYFHPLRPLWCLLGPLSFYDWTTASRSWWGLLLHGIQLLQSIQITAAMLPSLTSCSCPHQISNTKKMDQHPTLP